MSETGHDHAGHIHAVRIYALSDPALLLDSVDSVGACVRQALGGPGRAIVRLSQPSAWLDYRDEAELWKRSPPALPDAERALKAAENALIQVERVCSSRSPMWPRSLAGISPLPPVHLLRRATLSAVPRPDGSCWDHWLYRAEPQLDLDANGGRRVLVGGAQVEVRVGHAGRVIGLRARWHALGGRFTLAALQPFTPDGGGHHGAEETRDDAVRPQLQYQLHGDGIPQYYLAPFYVRAEGHVVNTYPASPWSLTVDIGRIRQGPESMTLLALARGGSGQYDFNWATAPATGPASELSALGPGLALRVRTQTGTSLASRIELANGAYLVLINVRDRTNGSFRHHQQFVTSSLMRSGGAHAVA